MIDKLIWEQARKNTDKYVLKERHVGKNWHVRRSKRKK